MSGGIRWLVQNRTRSRTRNRFRAAPAFALDNSNDDHGRAGREDYSVEMTGGGTGQSPAFVNTAQTASCEAGTTGDDVTVPAGKWAAASQAAADALALAEATEGLVCVVDGIVPYLQNVTSLARDSAGRYYLGGRYIQITVSGVVHLQKALVRLNADLTFDDTFVTDIVLPANGDITCITVLSTGKVMIGGNAHGFGTIDGNARNGAVARLNSDGSLDTGYPDVTFYNYSGTDFVDQIVETTAEAVLVCGWFTYVDGPYTGTVTSLVHLAADGSLAINFACAQVHCILKDADGKYLIGGEFGSILGNTINNIARLNADLSFDSSFTSPLNLDGHRTWRLAQQTSGKYILAGNFVDVGGTTRPGLCRLNSDGSLDATFDAAMITSLYTVDIYLLEVLPDDTIFVRAAQVGTIGGVTVTAPWVDGLVKFNADGAWLTGFKIRDYLVSDPSFSPMPGAFIRSADASGLLVVVSGPTFNSVILIAASDGTHQLP